MFIPTETGNYETVTTKKKLVVNKGENAPDMPGDTMNVGFSCRKVADVTLGRNHWVWKDSDLETALVVGEEITATAVYTGADRGNYKNETVTVKITRSVCEHPGAVEIKNAKEATCTEEGYTGDSCCTECGEVLTSGIEIPAKGHSFTSEITKQPTTAEEGIETYTCGNCGYQYTEAVAKLDGSKQETENTGHGNQQNAAAPFIKGENGKEGWNVIRDC